MAVMPSTCVALEPSATRPWFCRYHVGHHDGRGAAHHHLVRKERRSQGVREVLGAGHGVDGGGVGVGHEAHALELKAHGVEKRLHGGMGRHVGVHLRPSEPQLDRYVVELARREHLEDGGEAHAHEVLRAGGPELRAAGLDPEGLGVGTRRGVPFAEDDVVVGGVAEPVRQGDELTEGAVVHVRARRWRTVRRRTLRSSRVSSARYASPIPPEPMGETIE